ncbi:hypothetical protein GQ457_09G011880 [Hibiscus cannabinus]
MVSDMVSASGDWDWSRISTLLPQEVLDQIAAIQPPQGWLNSDTPGWRWTVLQQFTTASSYDFIMDIDLSSIDPIWNNVWSLSIPQRVKTFLWLTIHNRNLTNAERFRRHLTVLASCDVCGSAMEYMDHILRHCRPARGLWSRVVQPPFLSVFLNMPFDEWLRNNIGQSNDTPWYGPRLEARFAVFCWLLWKDRCSVVIGSDVNPKDDLLFRGNRLVNECFQGATNRLMVSRHEQASTPTWCLPILGWVKGNMDASVNTTTRQAAIGGLIRDVCGDWVVGFTRPIGRCSALVAELWALHDTLHCARIGVSLSLKDFAVVFDWEESAINVELKRGYWEVLKSLSAFLYLSLSLSLSPSQTNEWRKIWGIWDFAVWGVSLTATAARTKTIRLSHQLN